MNLITSRCSSFLFACVVSVLMATGAYGETYPNRTVRIIVPVEPGGTTDTLGRLVAQELSKNLGQQFIIENKAGASGVIGTELASRATPDGYTLLVISTTHTINPSLNKSLPFEPISGFSPITLLASAPAVVVVNPSLPVKNLKEFIAYAKTSGKALNYSSAGRGTPTALIGELFNTATGVQMTHVSYKGSGPALIAVLGGEVEVNVSTVITALKHIKSGKLRPLGVTSLKRSAVLPDVPTIAEEGFPSFEVGLWYAVLGPAGMNSAMVNFLHSEISKALFTNSVKSYIASEGGEVSAAGPQQLREYMLKELKRYQQIIQSTGIKAFN